MLFEYCGVTCLKRSLAGGLVHFFLQPASSHPWFAVPSFRVKTYLTVIWWIMKARWHLRSLCIHLLSLLELSMKSLLGTVRNGNQHVAVPPKAYHSCSWTLRWPFGHSEPFWEEVEYNKDVLPLKWFHQINWVLNHVMCLCMDVCVCVHFCIDPSK